MDPPSRQVQASQLLPLIRHPSHNTEDHRFLPPKTTRGSTPNETKVTIQYFALVVPNEGAGDAGRVTEFAFCGLGHRQVGGAWSGKVGGWPQLGPHEQEHSAVRNKKLLSFVRSFAGRKESRIPF